MNTFNTVPLDEFSHEDRYKFLMASVLPRPVALVTTISEEGVLNAAPFSCYTVLSVTPPIFGVSVGLKADGSEKDTLRNLRARRECVLHIPTVAMARQVNLAGQDCDSHTSEIALAGWHVVDAVKVGAPRIVEAPIQFECVLRDIVEYGDRRSALCVVEAVHTHAAQGVVQGHRVDHALLDALGRIGGGAYCSARDAFSAPAAAEPFQR